MINEPKTVKSEPIRLLLIDDEKDFVKILSKRIRRRNIAVTEAFSGAEGIQALRAQEFDVAVLDLKMEDMDGIEVLKMLKIMDPRLVVIMLTGHGSAEAAEQGIRLGAFDYLTKPCELEELLEKIMEAYAHRQQDKRGKDVL
jgi:DNA-binding NtrC family response regulator